MWYVSRACPNPTNQPNPKNTKYTLAQKLSSPHTSKQSNFRVTGFSKILFIIVKTPFACSKLGQISIRILNPTWHVYLSRLREGYVRYANSPAQQGSHPLD